jgi:hypothetical protein
MLITQKGQNKEATIYEKSAKAQINSRLFFFGPFKSFLGWRICFLTKQTHFFFLVQLVLMKTAELQNSVWPATLARSSAFCYNFWTVIYLCNHQNRKFHTEPPTPPGIWKFAREPKSKSASKSKIPKKDQKIRNVWFWAWPINTQFGSYQNQFSVPEKFRGFTWP